MKITIPDFCLVLLCGAPCSGKSTFARPHIKANEGAVAGDAAGRWRIDDLYSRELDDAASKHRATTDDTRKAYESAYNASLKKLEERRDRALPQSGAELRKRLFDWPQAAHWRQLLG